MNNQKYESGARLWLDFGTAGDEDFYTVEVVRSDKPADEHGRTHWAMTIDAAQWTFHFYAWLRPGSDPLDSAHRYFARTFGEEIDAAKSWPAAQVENARAVLEHARRNVAKLGSRGVITYDLVLVAIGLSVVLAVRVAVGVWG